MVALPSALPDWASLPLIIGGALVVAGTIRLFQRRPPVPLPGPAPKSPLAAGIQRAEADLARIFSARLGARVRTTSHGAVEIDPGHLAIWLIVDSDAQRDRLKALPDFDATCREALSHAGYPEASIPLVHFAAESEETVHRDWGGNWWHYFK